MSTNFKNEFIKITKDNFRKQLIEIILEKDDFIYNNYQIFKYIINFDISPGGIINIKKNILEKQNPLLKIINNCEKPYLEETILNIFEYKILNYFNMIKEIDFENEPQNRINFGQYYQTVLNEKPNETLIIFDLSLKIFKECIDYLDYLENSVFDKEKENNNHNLYKLYCISYIKIYLNKLANFIYDPTKFQKMPDIKSIIDAIKGGNENDKLRKVIKIYLFKIFYNLTGKNYDNMINTYDFPGKGIDFVNILTKKENMNKHIKEIICEEKSPTKEIYKDFPLLKYFIYTEYRSKKEFLKELGEEAKYKKEYPLLYEYLKEEKLSSKINKLLFLPYFNEFNNYMIEYYSFNISREEAKSKVLNQEPIFSEKGFKIKFKNFLNSWNKIKKFAVKYKDYEMEVKNLNDEDKLIYFLNDINEKGYGMYLAAGYQNFINWQNEFLQYIIDNCANKNYLNCYLENLEKRIPIHEATSNQILRLINCFDGVYEDFDDLLNSFSRRKIFNKNGIIDYSKYNLFEYDISSIEEELANFILPGKCLFEEENNFFVTYWGEGFNGSKSNILNTFCKKYKQKDLDDNEKNIIDEYIKRHQNKDEFKQFFIALQIIIFYLINDNDDIDYNNLTIWHIIEHPPEYLKVYLNTYKKNCLEFFKEDQAQKLKLDKILNVFFFFEHLCFNDLIQTLQNEYKEEIEEELKAKIKEKLLDNNNFQDDISILELGAPLRRFISRYLVGKKQKTDIDPQSMLLPQLKRIDLWGNNINNIDNILKLIEEFKITVGQSLSFYEQIKEKDEKEIHIEANESDEENDDDDDDEIVKHPLPKKTKKLKN